MTPLDVIRKRDNLWRRNTANWWRVRRSDGTWLHADGQRWTSDERYLYLGTTAQLENLAATSPALKGDDWTAVCFNREVRGHRPISKTV